MTWWSLSFKVQILFCFERETNCRSFFNLPVMSECVLSWKNKEEGQKINYETTRWLLIFYFSTYLGIFLLFYFHFHFLVDCGTDRLSFGIRWNGREETETISSSKTFGLGKFAVVFTRRTILRLSCLWRKNNHLVDRSEVYWVKRFVQDVCGGRKTISWSGVFPSGFLF